MKRQMNKWADRSKQMNKKLLQPRRLLNGPRDRDGNKLFI